MVVGPSQKNKLQKQEPMAFGLLQLETTLSWDALLQFMVCKIESTVPNLVVSTLEWRTMKPANSTWMPLRTAMAYGTLVKQMITSKNVNIIICMDPPKPPVMASLVST
jgi:hypothetical protein